MKQKYFFSFLLALFFAITNAQNNALNVVGDDRFYLSGLNGFGLATSLDRNNFTIEYDFYLNSPENYNGGFIAGNGVVEPLNFYVDNTGASFLKLGNASTFEIIPGTPTFNIGQWYHVAFVVNNNAPKNIKMYVNGILVTDFNFTQSLNTNNVDYGIYLGSLYDTGNCKFDNLRIWNTLRSATEILNNFNNCLNNNENGLIISMDFDRSNIGAIRNRVASSPHTNGLSGITTFSTGTGCTTPIVAPAVNVTGNYAGTYYAAGYQNGKPFYLTDEVECDNFHAEFVCDMLLGKVFKIFWDTNQWVLSPAGCVWLFTSCDNEYVDSTTILGTNPSNTPFAPCTGWTFEDTNASATFTSADCGNLNTNNFDIANFEVYPNPFNSFFTINCKEEANVVIYDIVGKVVKEQNLNVGSNKLDLEQNSKGIYFAKIENEKGSQIIKLVKS